jgi:hypothetical protein
MLIWEHLFIFSCEKGSTKYKKSLLPHNMDVQGGGMAELVACLPTEQKIKGKITTWINTFMYQKWLGEVIQNFDC